MAKSTLLRALQTERSNVHELENIRCFVTTTTLPPGDGQSMTIDRLNNQCSI
jgi:hypothetical protein